MTVKEELGIRYELMKNPESRNENDCLMIRAYIECFEPWVVYIGNSEKTPDVLEAIGDKMSEEQATELWHYEEKMRDMEEILKKLFQDSVREQNGYSCSLVLLEEDKTYVSIHTDITEEANELNVMISSYQDGMKKDDDKRAIVNCDKEEDIHSLTVYVLKQIRDWDGIQIRNWEKKQNSKTAPTDKKVTLPEKLEQFFERYYPNYNQRIHNMEECIKSNPELIKEFIDKSVKDYPLESVEIQAMELKHQLQKSVNNMNVCMKPSFAQKLKPELKKPIQEKEFKSQVQKPIGREESHPKWEFVNFPKEYIKGTFVGKDNQKYSRIFIPGTGSMFEKTSNIHESKYNSNEVFLVMPGNKEVRISKSRRIPGVPDSAPEHEKYRNEYLNLSVMELQENIGKSKDGQQKTEIPGMNRKKRYTR